MISKKLAIEILNRGLETGADFAEIYFEDTLNESIALENGVVEGIGNNSIYGVGIRLLKDNRSVYGYTNDLTKKGLFELTDKLKASFNSKRIIENITSIKKVKVKDIHKVITKCSSVKKEVIIDLLKSLYEDIHTYDKRIVRVTTGFLIYHNFVTIFNSEGKMYQTEREHSRVLLSSAASFNNKIETRFDGPGNQGGFEYFTKTIDLHKIAKNHAEKLILMLEAKECPSGKFPVVIGNGWGGVIFHEACGHQLEATAVAKGVSVFSNMKGEKIANSIVSVYDDGSLPNEWGSSSLDDEGLIPQKNELIKDGILTGYLVDSFNGRRMNEKGNGCSRRQSYKYEPTSRMSNTYIAPSKDVTPDDIIKNTKLALYAVSFNGGSVNPATGDFNFGCSEAYIIKDGKIDHLVKDASLVGYGYEVLMNIDMVGNDLGRGQGMCGASSGSIPVDVGQPTIRVQNVTVGGRGSN